ncbi:MAG TPA: hypothetical protein VNA17_07740 [Pyrinomonadaceae bacterium]|nr:hypothetical protein [Pyrinomonadaceae bacterium]
MKRTTFRVMMTALLVLGTVGPAYSQREGRTTFTGTAVIYGTGASTRTITRQFTLRIDNVTSQADADRFLRVLERGGQDDLLREIDDNDLGRFSLGASVGLPLNAVLVDNFEGLTRVRAVFARWIGFGELRYGHRSVDYPFSYVELIIDRDGRGQGSYFQAARIRSRPGNTIEIEDFGTFPSKLMGVQMRGRRLG